MLLTMFLKTVLNLRQFGQIQDCPKLKSFGKFFYNMLYSIPRALLSKVKSYSTILHHAGFFIYPGMKSTLHHFKVYKLLMDHKQYFSSRKQKDSQMLQKMRDYNFLYKCSARDKNMFIAENLFKITITTLAAFDYLFAFHFKVYLFSIN